jgi:hypothetical protein
MIYRESLYCFCRQLVPQYDCPVYEGVFTDALKTWRIWNVRNKLTETFVAD